MKQELEKCLDELDAAIHDSMINTAMRFMDMDMTTFNEVLDSTGGVVTVLQARHMHAIVAFMGAMLDSNIPLVTIRAQANALKEGLNDMVDDAVTQAICQNSLNVVSKEGAIQ